MLTGCPAFGRTGESCRGDSLPFAVPETGAGSRLNFPLAVVSPADARHHRLPAPVGAIRQPPSPETRRPQGVEIRVRASGDEGRPPCPSRACRDRSGNSRDASLLQSRPPCPVPLRQPRRHYAAPASSDDAPPQRTSVLPGLSQVTTPRDGLPARQKPRTVQRGLPSPLPRDMSARPPTGAPEPWGNGSPDGSDPRRKRHRRQYRVPRQPAKTRHETGWCPVSLVVPATPGVPGRQKH